MIKKIETERGAWADRARFYLQLAKRETDRQFFFIQFNEACVSTRLAIRENLHYRKEKDNDGTSGS